MRLLALALLLTGCATITNLEDFTLIDLRAAQERATRGQDKIAMACYPVLITRLEERLNAPASVKPVGAVDAFEAARLIVHAPPRDNSDIQLGCAALAMQTAADLAKFDAKVVSLIASSGASAPSDIVSWGSKLIGLLKALGVGQ